MKVAIVGRRNVGKSTFINTLAQAERMIVSEVPGTTRDSVDVRFELDGKTFVAIDTPGIARERKSRQHRHRLLQHAPRAAEHPPGRRGAAVLRRHAADQQGRQAALRVHRREVQAVRLRRQQVGPARRTRCRRKSGFATCSDTFRTMRYVPIAFITGQTGKNVKALLNHGQMLFKQSRARVATGAAQPHAPGRRCRATRATGPQSRPKIYYATQVGMQPPTIVLFCNDPRHHRRRIAGTCSACFRDHLTFGEVPIKLYLQKRRATTGATTWKPGKIPRMKSPPSTECWRRGRHSTGARGRRTPEQGFEIEKDLKGNASLFMAVTRVSYGGKTVNSNPPFYPKRNLDLLDANSTVSTFTHPRCLFSPQRPVLRSDWKWSSISRGCGVVVSWLRSIWLRPVVVAARAVRWLPRWGLPCRRRLWPRPPPFLRWLRVPRLRMPRPLRS